MLPSEVSEPLLSLGVQLFYAAHYPLGRVSPKGMVLLVDDRPCRCRPATAGRARPSTGAGEVWVLDEAAERREVWVLDDVADRLALPEEPSEPGEQRVDPGTP